jgi:hypothetical protein
MNSVDGSVDCVNCGAGTDSATVDKPDVVAGNCEHVSVDKPHRQPQRLGTKS